MKWSDTTASKCRYGEIAGEIWGGWDVIWECSSDDYQGHAARQNPEHRSLPKGVPVSAPFEKSAVRIKNAADQKHEREGDNGACGRNAPYAGKGHTRWRGRTGQRRWRGSTS